ncbi:hypothetical protein F5X99DRAFT_412205 [Biscogniauxia marginata]|nr:hypothetical protein F5X99DRAFT_412205 [Biscogniauxia marginata]
MQSTRQKSQIIYAPSREPVQGVKSVFLAGTTSKTDDRDWRLALSELLASLPLTIFNPYRPDWDSSWREDISFVPYREQTDWELEMQEAADIVVVFFHPATQAPVSLLEFGLCAKSGRAMVVCPEGYCKRGNVQIVCQRYGVEMVETIDGIKDAIVKRKWVSSHYDRYEFPIILRLFPAVNMRRCLLGSVVWTREDLTTSRILNLVPLIIPTSPTMDDQFNGRTDDDLFADDFEPVGQDEQISEAAPISEPVVESQTVSPSVPEASRPAQLATVHSTPKSLSQSRHAKPAHQPRPRKHSPKQAPATTTAADSSQPLTTGESHSGIAAVTTPSTTANTAPSAASSSSPVRPGSNTALADRLASGANPRTKLTESELAAKMERMRILAAEKTRKFEQAEQDSRSHALAYERGMEEARRRRAEEAERRRKGEEERRRMDEERAANRERKLKAMGAKEGAWDEGKNIEEEQSRFRGANGGVRGARNTAGIAGSRFASSERDDLPVREFSADEFRGKGRGRGRGTSRGGRGGRGGASSGGGGGGFGDGGRGFKTHPQANVQNGASKPKDTQVIPTTEDFPALPPLGAQKLDTASKPNDAENSVLLPAALQSPLTGKWDDEMEALDATTENGV